MKERKASLQQVLTIIVMGIFILGLMFLHMSIHEKFVLGWDKDCREQIKGLDNEMDYPWECQDFGKYHLMLMFSVGTMAMSMMMTVMLFTWLNNDQSIREDKK